MRRPVMIVVFLLLLVLPAAGAAGGVSVVVDDIVLPLDAAPVIEGGRTLVPFRGLAESLGVTVDWNGAAGTVHARAPGKTVELRINDREALVDGHAVSLDAPPVIQQNRTLIPLRFFGEAFGATVEWSAATRTVTVLSPPAELYAQAFYAIRSFPQVDLIGRFDSVVFGWARLRADGALDLEGPDFYWPAPAGTVTPETILESARRAGTARYLMVFMADGEGELTTLLSGADAAARGVREIADFAGEKGFDGVLLDFEGLGMSSTPEELRQVRDRFNAFVQEMAAALRPQGMKLSLALHPLNSAYRGYDYHTLGQVADEITIMAYEYQDARAPEPNEKVQEAVRLALGEVPAGKLVLGINVWNETPESIRAKAGLAKRYGLRGVSLWRLGLLDPSLINRLEQTVCLKQNKLIS
ncbi:MAG: glycosyl hydrolase [Candidatus Desulforudis sp.]|nr:glycosyl hydrolase [Desulforudis sp.]